MYLLSETEIAALFAKLRLQRIYEWFLGEQQSTARNWMRIRRVRHVFRIRHDDEKCLAQSTVAL